MRKHRSRQRQNRPLQVFVISRSSSRGFFGGIERDGDWVSSAVLKSTRDCTMLGSSMRRVGLIDITVGNATRLGASQRSATRRCASHHIATQRLSRRGSPVARARLARTAPSMVRALNHGKPNPAIVPRQKLNKAYRIVR